MRASAPQAITRQLGHRVHVVAELLSSNKAQIETLRDGGRRGMAS